MTEYVTSQGDTWDFIAYKIFGSESYMQQLMEANFDLLDTLIFPANVKIKVPEIGIDISNDVDQPSWRSVDSEGDELFSASDIALETSEDDKEDY